MSVLQVEFTKNSVDTTPFPQSFLDSLFHLVLRAARGFLGTVLRSQAEPDYPGALTSTASSVEFLKSDMVHFSQHLRNHENHTFESIKTVDLSYPSTCARSRLNHLHINERQLGAGLSDPAKAVSTRERVGAMRGVSHVGHRIESTTGYKLGRCTFSGSTTGSPTGGSSQATNWGFHAGPKVSHPNCDSHKYFR